MTGPDATPQLGFDALLAAGEAANRARRFAAETAHLPRTIAEAIPFYRILLRHHHAAMLAADVDEAMRLRREAALLAVRLNGGDPGILAGREAPGCLLERETQAAPGTVPLWGQTGAFLIAIDGMKVRIALDGVFGVTARICFWPGFAAHAVDWDRPFLSDTGYRSFLGIHADAAPGLTPEDFTRKVVAAHLARELKGRPVPIEDRYRREGAT